MNPKIVLRFPLSGHFTFFLLCCWTQQYFCSKKTCQNWSIFFKDQSYQLLSKDRYLKVYEKKKFLETEPSIGNQTSFVKSLLRPDELTVNFSSFKIVVIIFFQVTINMSHFFAQVELHILVDNCSVRQQRTILAIIS